MSVHQHKRAGVPVNCMIMTISDTRTEETDKSGNLMANLLVEAGHKVKERTIVTDEKNAIRSKVLKMSEQENIDVILTNGGTGIAHRDITIETIKPMLDKEMTGFGEIFRMLSYQEDIGSSAIMSRAIAGVIDNMAVFSTPGSSGAVKLAMNKLIIPELAHVVNELKKDVR
ncbi:molybdenum cofactor biosynthesis protein B [Lentibacillus kapialis]|uniref:Molybdenum cofactor biosynthesis protein B n=1 Tax=Lentibacillus kapialis TaxID=340214 RepID=A0A917PWF7_9BACI|nr:MogA/MoaB family molybdenum cofactor biosynthesis protein [Lentibacillus kapialis]GGJ96686.1 molybdenum cofactor biosynthesis protein B [Lentibacillus kapialis]